MCFRRRFGRPVPARALHPPSRFGRASPSTSKTSPGPRQRSSMASRPSRVAVASTMIPPSLSSRTNLETQRVSEAHLVRSTKCAAQYYNWCQRQGHDCRCWPITSSSVRTLAKQFGKPVAPFSAYSWSFASTKATLKEHGMRQPAGNSIFQPAAASPCP